ncbi:MAG: outer membrane lipoprotein - activator of MrcB activity [Sodalis sp. Psp]|nr:outer membrane lipoprotein - activator of MrcB activity [Sodalis sp. Psp]MCR3756554.1 outer membrane lipoprotein - activator of MrcB activity [Sodalis sp. Ppy]
MKKIPLIIFSAPVLASCTANLPQLQPVTIEPTQPLAVELVPQPLATREPILMPPKIKSVDWQASLSPLVQQVVTMGNINDGSVLLVNTMKNSTNGSLQVGKATETLTRLITDAGSKFQVIGIDTLNSARQILGLSADDSLELRSKAVGLARYLNAQYMLYSTASGDAEHPDLDLQLMLVQTGEIIWFGKGIAQETPA